MNRRSTRLDSRARCSPVSRAQLRSHVIEGSRRWCWRCNYSPAPSCVHRGGCGCFCCCSRSCSPATAKSIAMSIDVDVERCAHSANTTPNNDPAAGRRFGWHRAGLARTGCLMAARWRRRPRDDFSLAARANRALRRPHHFNGRRRRTIRAPGLVCVPPGWWRVGGKQKFAWPRHCWRPLQAEAAHLRRARAEASREEKRSL